MSGPALGRRLLPWLLLGPIAFVAWFARGPAVGDPVAGDPVAGNPVADSQAADNPAAGASLTPELAYRARAVQLALAGGATDRDWYLAHPGGASAPFSPHVPLGLAAVAARLGSGHLPVSDPDLRATAGVREDALERLLLALPRIGAVLACALAFVAVRGLAEGPRFHGADRVDGAVLSRGDVAGLAAAAVQAAAPVWLTAERAGAASVEPLAAAMLFAMVLLLRDVGRGRDLTDATLAGMLGGGFAGGAILLTCTALPVALTAFVVIALRASNAPNERRADGWRALTLFAMAAIVLVSIPAAGDASLSRRVLAGAGTLGWWARALSPLLALGVGLACLGRGVERVKFASAALTLTIALVFLGAPLRSAFEGAATAPRAALLWMRTGTPSPGPFNHADAPQDWAVLSSAAYGGWLTYYGRRPVIEATFPSSARPGPGALARELLLLTDTGELALGLRSSGVRYVAVAPPMVTELLPRGGGRDTALVRLALWSGGDGGNGVEPYPGLELVHASEAWSDVDGRPADPGTPEAGPALSIWRAQLPPRSVPQAVSIGD